MNERIKVLHHAEVINAISDIFYNAEHRIDICGNSRFPSLIFSFESIRIAIMNAKNRKYTRQRYIFEITPQNIKHCKDLIKIVEQQQNIFEALWNKSIHAERKIKEIEEGIVHYETRIIEDALEIVKEISRLTDSSSELCTCLTAGGMQD